MNLFLLPSSALVESRATLTQAQAAHAIQVLRVAPGHTVRIGVENGPQGVGTVVDVAGTLVTLECGWGECQPVVPRVDILIALPRPKVMRRLWAQLAALGVGRIMITNAERVERAYFDTHLLDETVYRPLLIEGLQQACDTRIPRVSVHRRFRVLIEDTLDEMAGDAHRIVADVGDHPCVDSVVDGVSTARVLVAIGPEGGWNAFERAMLARHRFISVSMGARTLRTDTACVALLALVHQVLSATRTPR